MRHLLKSYQDVGGINHIDGTNLPSKRAIPAICEDLLELLFPGFLTEEAPSMACVENITHERVARLLQRLAVEIARSLRCQLVAGPECDERAQTIGCRLLDALPEVRGLLRTDVEAAYEGDPAARSYEEIILSYPCIEAIAIQRVAHILYQEEVPLLPRMMTEWAHARTGIDIHPGAQIGSHFFIDHGTGVVIGETCVIGSHVKLYHGVTLGALSFAKDEAGRIKKGGQRHPQVEENVTIYPNATILGGQTVIGRNSTIGANAFISSSVAPFQVVSPGEQEHKILDKRLRPKAVASPIPP
ncbi:MAG: serine O-acetyltransferase EpsC [Verrucomicrobiales bacterium]